MAAQSKSEHDSATLGQCAAECDLVRFFLPIMAICIFTWFMTAPPSLQIIIRCEDSVPACLQVG